MHDPYHFRRDDEIKGHQAATAADIARILAIPFTVAVVMASAILFCAWLFG